MLRLFSTLKKSISGGQEEDVAKCITTSKKAKTHGGFLVVVQCVEDSYYLGLFGQIAKSLREQRAIRVEQYVFRSLRVGESRSIGSFVMSRLFVNPLHCFKWVGIYRSFCDGVAYRSTSTKPIADVRDLIRAYKIWGKLENKVDLLKLEINGVPVGDLVNDSYLRFKPAPTVDIKNFYLLILLWQACRDIRRATDYFSKTQPSLYLTSYSTYIQHGIPVRVALQHGVKVYAFGNYQDFAKKLTLDDWMHTRNPDRYAEQFALMTEKEEKLAFAEKGLMTRLSGGIDAATSYMKQSAYVDSGSEVPAVEGAVVVFLHDFYDSPHVYREMVFPDFWEWITFTVEVLKKHGKSFYLKPHPNQIRLSDVVLKELKERYPDVKWVSPKITNKQLAEAKMACAVTVYGTVAHEMAFLGIPSIGCARHPHISFDFCKTATNPAEYADLLAISDQLLMDREAIKKQSLVFYYMHNYYLSEDEQQLRNLLMNYRAACNASINSAEMTNLLRDLGRQPALSAKLSDWLAK